MMRIALIVTLGLGLNLSLVGCGDDNEETDDTPTEEPEGDEDPVQQMPVTPTYGVNAFAYEGLGIDALVAQGYSGVGVSVCVVDSGIDAAHPAFAHLAARSAIAWADFTSEASSTPVDTNGHGTHVAGIIAMNDELTGGAPNVDLLIARVFTADGGTDYATIAAGVDWCRTNGADLISMSLGGLSLPAIDELLNEDPTATENAVERALDAGIFVVAAAGNTEVARDVATPSDIQGVIAVGALNTDLETKALFSQSGINDGRLLIEPRSDPNKKPEVSAPGVSITSAMVAGSSIATDQSSCDEVLYCALNGTSQATPFVTAVLALVLEARPALQAANNSGRAAIGSMKTALSESAAPTPGQTETHDDGTGYGVIDVAALLERI